ncbi:hypothetical protein [Paenibacillus sp. GCM10012303]|uniref:hypothetical protein n=1 Tax=Paenibacillus sp. GCM10012303 TaxID=3317340 RepID=UPI003610AAF9
MRIIGIILTVIGLLIVIATAVLWMWLNAFACGMSPTGCGGFSLNWGDSEALGYFIPPFIFGCLLTAVGIITIVKNRNV